MEVSSHGLVQNRLLDVPFYIAIFTNLTQDHLDYHKTMEKYALAKWSFFKKYETKKIILNINNQYGKKWLKKLSNKYTVAVSIKNTKYKKYANKWINATNIKFNGKFTNVKFESSWGKGILSTYLIGQFNIENLLLSFASMLEMDYKLSDLILTSVKLKPIRGRMQIFKKIGKPTFIIDYAHTPDALKKALTSIKQYYPSKKIWCIFGCGGARDINKRPIMGNIAEKIADKLIITSDNPRNESLEIIIQNIIQGCIKKNTIKIILNREQAIYFAFFHANIEDIIFISGKGHENYQIINNQYIYHSDIKIVLSLLGKKK